MKSSTTEILPIIGTSMDGGFYAGRIRIGDQAFALIVAGKADGEIEQQRWIGDCKDVPGAKSYFDGLANTRAMVEAGSELARWAQGLRIGGHDDWYIPAQDELEILYRNLKPTTDENTGYARSGINLSAVTPTYPYTPDSPAQTPAEAFQDGAGEAFDDVCYWSSTQHASLSGFAWGQVFAYGYQHDDGKSYEGRARAVRRLAI